MPFGGHRKPAMTLLQVREFLSYAYTAFHGFAARVGKHTQRWPFLLASNHLSFLDPPAWLSYAAQLALFCPGQSFKGPLGMLIRALNSIQVNRSQLDLATLRTVLKVLKDGHPLLVFPRVPEVRMVLWAKEKKVGMLVAKSQVPVYRAYFRIV